MKAGWSRMRTVVVHANTMNLKHNRGRTILILQAWLVSCHGFGSTSCLKTSHVALRALQRHTPLFRHDQRLRTLSDVVRRRLSRLNMAEKGEGFHDPYGDERRHAAVAAVTAASQSSMPVSNLHESQEQEPPWGRGVDAGSENIAPVQPFREEHTAGGSKFSELLARAKGETPARSFQAAPRHPVPPGGPNDYDQDSQWEDQLIGSPNLPDPPLRNEMPGLKLSPEINYDRLEEASPGDLGSGGDRFQRMMQQAQTNEQRQAAGIPPRSAPNSRPSRADARPLPPSKEEKERALKAAVERQQNMMAKARGIDLDDPTLEGKELAKRRALSRAQAGATTGGYVPSSNAADDYLAALKVDSKRKHRDLQARLEGRALAADEPSPTMKGSEAPALASSKGDLRQGETPDLKFAPQRRTKAMSSIQNSADVYMASLKGVKIEIPKNPYLAEERELARPGQKLSPEQIAPSLPSSPKQQPPTSTTMTYTERLELARAAKSAGTMTTTPPTAHATAPAPAVDVPSHAPAAVAPDTGQPATPVVSYAEKMKQAREAKAARVAGSPPPPPVQTVRAAPSLVPTRSRPDAFGGAELEEDDTHAKIMQTMDLLTEHKTTGLVGEERVAKLRRALVETRDALRTEMREQPSPWKAAQMSVPPPIAPPSAPQPPRISPASAHQDASQAAVAPPTLLTADDRDTLRRCSVLLQAHAHSSLSGRDLVALREGLASSLEIVEGRVDGGVSADSGTNGGGHESAPPSESEREAVPASVGGVQSVGGILTEMGVGRKPDAFQPDNNASGKEEWTGGSLGEYEKSVGTKALGYLLKHRGGKGYGRGRVKGAQAEEMVSTLAELTEIFQEEMIED